MVCVDSSGNLSINWKSNTALIDVPTLTTWATNNASLVTTEQTTEVLAAKVAKLTSLGLYRVINELANLAGQTPATFLQTYLD